MKPGLELTGRVIDDETGEPVEGIEVYAMPRVAANEDGLAVSKTFPYGYMDALAKTDETGFFKIHGLIERDHTLSVRGGNPARRDQSYSPGQNQHQPFQ